MLALSLPYLRPARPLILCLALSMDAGLRAEETESGADVAALLRKAQAGDVAAQLEVTEHFLINATADLDRDPARDFKQVEKWLQAAALKGSAPAARMLGELLLSDYPGIPVNPARAFAAFQKAALAGDFNAMLQMGHLHSSGTGTPQNLAKAEEWWQKALATAPEGSPERDQASMMLMRLADMREAAVEREELAKAAESTDAETRFQLGRRLLREAGSDQEQQTAALGHLRFAAEAGHAGAQDAYGAQLEQQDRAAGFAWRLKAAESGHASAQGYAALVLLRGNGSIPADPAKGLDLVVRAQLQGEHFVGRTLNGPGYFPGLSAGDAQNLAYSTVPAHREQLLAAAARGEPEAQRWLARGPKPEPAAITRWLALAAKQEHPAAQFSLAIAYFNGDEVPRDKVQSVAWKSRAALLGYSDAASSLAHHYLAGDGVPANPALARYWFERTASDETALEAHRKIARDQAAAITVPAAPPATALEQAKMLALSARLPAVTPPKRSPDETRIAAEKGDAEAMYQLGLADLERRRIWSNKLNGVIPVDRLRDETDFRWIMAAARAGHPEAQFLAATHTLSAETDAAKKTWLEKAAAQNHAAAQERLAAHSKAAANAATQAAAAAKQAAADRELAAKGDADAAFRLFRARVGEIARAIVADFSAGQNGQPTSGKNYKLGYLDADMIKWGDTITTSLHADGLVMLHDYLRDDRPDFAYRALLLRERIAKTDLRLQLPDSGFGTNSRAGFEKALAHLRGKLTPAQLAQTEKGTADQFGGPQFENVIGANFERGVCGYPQDHGLALVHYRRAAEAGYASGQTNLARCYDFGLGVAQDPVQAREWYAKAAAQGNATAQTRLQELTPLTPMARIHALSAEQRAKLTNDDWAAAEAQLLIKEQAQKLFAGDPGITLAVAACYRDGSKGFVQDYGRALYWLLESSRQGNTDATVEVGNFLYVGRGGPVDKPAAFKNFLRAAELGNAAGQLMTGLCYYEGEVVPRDLLQAHDWLKRAADQGNTKARAQLEALAKDAGLQLLLAQRNEQQALRNAEQGVVAALSNPPPSAPAYDPIKDNPILQQAALATKALQGDQAAAAELKGQQQQLAAQRDLINASPVPPPPVPKAGAVQLANLQMEAIPAAAGLDRQHLIQEMNKLRLDTMSLHLQATFSNISRYRLKEVQELLAKGDKPKARTLLLEAVQDGMTAAVPVWQQHFPDEPVSRPDYRGDQPGLWPGDAGWPDAQAKFAEGIVRWETDPVAARPLLEAAAQAGLAEAYTFLATNRKDLRPGEFDDLLNAAFDRGHAVAAWRQRRVRVFQPDTELALASVEKLTADAAGGSSDAGLMLGVKLLPTNPVAALERIGRLAADGHGGAEMVLAGLYAQGRSLPADATQVFAWLARAAVKGSQEAQIHFGDYLAGKYGGAAQSAFARFWYLRAAAFPREKDYLARLANLRAIEIDVAPETAFRAFAQARKLAAGARVPGDKPAEASAPPAKSVAPAAAETTTVKAKAEAAGATADDWFAYARALCPPPRTNPERKGLREAFPWLLKAAEAGHPLAGHLVVLGYRSGFPGTPPDDAKAVQWLEKLAAAGNPTAILQVARGLESGLDGFIPDAARARKLYRQLAESKNPEGTKEWERVQREDAVNPKPRVAGETRARLLAMAQQGDRDALALYHAVIDYAVDASLEARLKEAVAAAHQPSLVVEAQQWLIFAEDSQSQLQALTRLKEAAQAGNHEARFLYGQWLFEKDPTTAVTQWQLAAQGGHARAHETLGHAYRQGTGVSASYPLARRHYRAAAALGLIRACDLVVQAAQAERSSLAYGRILQGKQAGEEERVYEEALAAEIVTYANRGAAAAEPAAMVSLALMLADGNDVKRDQARAMQLLQAAAKAGHGDAHRTLAAAHEGAERFGQPRDIAKAADHFAALATQGDGGAAFRLGGLNEGADGHPKNPAQAYLYFALAADLGTDAVARRNAAAAQLTPAQRIDTDRRLDQIRLGMIAVGVRFALPLPEPAPTR